MIRGLVAAATVGLAQAQGQQAQGPAPGLPGMPGGAPIAGAPADGGPPHDIRELLPYVTPWQTYALWAATALALLALAAWLYLRWRKRTGRGVVVETPVDPWDALARRLGSLTPHGKWGRREQEDHWFELSMILREAIELRTRIPATDLTLQELRDPLRRKLPLPSTETDAVLVFCERADHVKFASAESTVPEAEAASRRVEAWVRSLKPRVEESPTGVRGTEASNQ